MPYIRKPITREEYVIHSAVCDNCEKVLEVQKFFEHIDVQISGGYGSFIDDTLSWVFCEACVRKLMDTFPCMNVEYNVPTWREER